MENNTVTIPICRYEELIDIETRVNILIDKLDVEKHVSEENIYLILGYTKRYKEIKQKKEKESEEFWRKHHLESATESTDIEKELVVQI